MLLVIVSCGNSVKEDEATKVSNGIKVGVEKDLEFKVFHVNDIHGRVDEGKYDGMGLARISTIVKGARKEDPNVLFLDA
jgi:2',3'-cyclic-nucleotide 2'-phosphodiesterase (5'-nucleotidase family)